MDVAFRRAVALARWQGDCYFAGLLGEELIEQAFGKAAVLDLLAWRHGCKSLSHVYSGCNRYSTLTDLAAGNDSSAFAGKL
jgi:hypothetical protein